MEHASDVSVPSVDLEAVRDVLEAAPVRVAVLYGSHARGEATARSDVDVAVGFDDSIDRSNRLQARLDLICRLADFLGTDDVDVVPLSGVHDTLRSEIWDHGVLLVGSRDDLSAYGEPEPPTDSHEERMAAFDEVLADLERSV